MKARIRDTEIFFDVEGLGIAPEEDRMVEQPVAFVIHGGPGGDHSSFKPAMSPLADKMQLVYFDHRGQGRSTRGPIESYTLENNVEDMEALRQRLGLDKIIVLGTSYGGMVGLTYAARYPENVSHLIAVVTAASHEFLDRAREIAEERGNEEQREAAQKLWAGAFEDEEELRHFFDVMGPLYGLSYDPEKAKKRWNRAILSVDAINHGFSTFLREYDVRDQLNNITCPTLVIAGRHDWICPPEFSEEIARLIPHADLRIFENSAHMVTGDEHQAFIDVVRGVVTYNQ